MEVVPTDTPGAQFARLLFTVRGRHEGLTWLELRPHTGRKHQLRVQLASRGCPIYGDAKYGSDRTVRPRHRTARPQPDVPAPDDEGTDHPDGRSAEDLARPLRAL